MESSDPLPFVQVDRSAMPKAVALATTMGCSVQQALGSLVLFWGRCADPRELEAVAGGVGVVLLTKEVAELRFRCSSGASLDVATLVDVGLLEPCGEAYRVRGMSRYIDAVRKRIAHREKSKRAGKASVVQRRLNAGSGKLTLVEPLVEPNPNQRSTTANQEDRGQRTEDRSLKERESPSLLTDGPGNTPRMGLAALQARWNALGGGFPRWLSTGKQRAGQARSRLSERPRPEDWEPVFAKLAGSRFLRGENDRGWVATPDWFLREESICRLLEGKYDDRKGSAGPIEWKDQHPEVAEGEEMPL